MAITLRKALTAIGVGVVDIGLQELDASQGWAGKAFKNATDLGRAALSLGSFAYSYIKPSELVDNLFVASTPLLVESVYYATKAATAAPATVVTPTVVTAPTPKATPVATTGKYVVTS